MLRLSSRAAVGIVVIAAIVAATGLDRWAEPPSADLARGTEGAFARGGLYWRELPPRQALLRWTQARAVFSFREVPSGPAMLEVRAHGHRGAVAVVVGGVVRGMLAPGAVALDLTVSVPADRWLEVTLEAQEPATLGGRTLGTQLDRVTLRHAPAGLPSPWLVAVLLIPALAVFGAAAWSRLGAAAATLVALAVTLLQALVLGQAGLARSDYAVALSWLLVLGAGLSAAGARFVSDAAGRRWAFLAALLAFLVQGIAATAPFMVVSDAVFHANKLGQVAGGDLFPTSLTQHARPFRIPYGVSFYALLAPLARAGLDRVVLVRAGAAAAGLVASAGLFALVAARRPAWQAALAVALLQFLPGTFDIYSYGNLSNVFGQAVTVLFFAWWAGRATGGWAVGAALVALGGLAHLSSFLVLVALCATLGVARRSELRRDRARLIAVAVGLSLAAGYYLSFSGLILEQLPRLLEGGGQGRGASGSVLDALRSQLQGALGQWGLPAVLLALVGFPRPSGSGFERDLAGFWVAGALLFLPAVVSPLDVRYLYALTLPVAVAASEGVVVLGRRGPPGRLGAALLVFWQGLLAGRGSLEALLRRYR